jgi:hypothetical protein
MNFTKRLCFSSGHFDGEDSVLVAAKDLVNNDTIYVDINAHLEYFHMLFDTHEIAFYQ